MAHKDDAIPSVPNIQHRFTTINGIRFHYAESGNGRPLIMLHGWPQHWYMWRHQIPRLAEKRLVICPDIRGFGWSDAPPIGYKKEELATDIIRLIESLNILRFDLMGHDWGGWIGFLLCLRYPDRVGKFLALNIPHPFQKIDSRLLTAWRFWYQFIIAFPLLGCKLIQKTAFVRKLLRIAAPKGIWSPSDEDIYISRLGEYRRARASTLLYRTFICEELTPVTLGRYNSAYLSTNTRMLFGRKDLAISPALLKGYEANASNLTIEYVENCGHSIAEENPKLVTKNALEFFGQ